MIEVAVEDTTLSILNAMHHHVILEQVVSTNVLLKVKEAFKTKMRILVTMDQVKAHKQHQGEISKDFTD